MSIELPKYTIQETSNHPRKKVKTMLFILFLSSFIAGAVFNAFVSGNTNTNLRTRNTVLEDDNTKNEDRITQQASEISLLKTEQTIKQQAVIALQRDYKGLLTQNSELESEIKFYEKLLSPNIKNKGLRVFAAKLYQQNEGAYTLKFSIVQKIAKAREVAGKYKVSVVGKQQGKTKTILVSNASDSSYKFKYFQNISLDFLVPNGFKAEQLVVNLLPKTKKAKTVEYKTDWLVENN